MRHIGHNYWEDSGFRFNSRRTIVVRDDEFIFERTDEWYFSVAKRKQLCSTLD